MDLNILSLAALKKKCIQLNLSLIKTNGSAKLKKDLIKSLEKKINMGGNKRRSRSKFNKGSRRRKSRLRKGNKKSRRKSRKNMKGGTITEERIKQLKDNLEKINADLIHINQEIKNVDDALAAFNLEHDRWKSEIQAITDKANSEIQAITDKANSEIQARKDKLESFNQIRQDAIDQISVLNSYKNEKLRKKDATNISINDITLEKASIYVA